MNMHNPSQISPHFNKMKQEHCKTLLILIPLTLSLITISYPTRFFRPVLETTPFPNKPATITTPPTNLTHIVFGLLASERAWPDRKSYIESWWRPNSTHGFLFLDKPPGPGLLPWPETSPPYRVSDDLTHLLNKNETRAQRMVHAIMEVLRELEINRQKYNNGDDFRWVVMGDDDSIFFVENMVDVLGGFDHERYYYLGGRSENVLSDYLFSFEQAFGGGGIMLSRRLAEAMARAMEGCLKRYVFLNSADNTTRACIEDIGANFTPLKGNHQIDLHGDISGLLSSHPLSPLLSLHHFDKVDPIFPAMDRYQSTRHLMRAAAAGQSRLLQQTICYHRHLNWTFSVSWGYSAHIYENIFPRSYLQRPIETFRPWAPTPQPPFYTFNTRTPSLDQCKAPHVFFFDSAEEGPHETLTGYSRARPRDMPACSSTGNHSADYVRRIRVFSPAVKRTEVDRCECCDIIGVDGDEAEIRFRKCLVDEIIA